jgi:hypothetical protein
MNRKMTCRPADDERLVVPEPGRYTGEKIFLTELAAYLHHRSGDLMDFARKHGFLKRIWARGAAVYWVHPYGAQRIISYIRALQGDHYLQGNDFHKEREQWAARMRKRRSLVRKGQG